MDALVNQGRFKVVSRDQLENILREMKLSRSALVDQATAVRAGKLAAAEAIMVATVNESPKSVEVYAQLINTETSTVLASRDIFDPEKAPGSARAKMRELAAKLKAEYPLVGGSVVTVSNQRVAVGMGERQEGADRHEGHRVPGGRAAHRPADEGRARSQHRIAGRGPAQGRPRRKSRSPRSTARTWARSSASSRRRSS